MAAGAAAQVSPSPLMPFQWEHKGSNQGQEHKDPLCSCEELSLCWVLLRRGFLKGKVLDSSRARSFNSCLVALIRVYLRYKQVFSTC